MIERRLLSGAFCRLTAGSADRLLESEPEGYFSELERILPQGISGITENPELLGDRVGFRAVLSEVMAILRAETGELGGFLILLTVFSLLSALCKTTGGKYSATATSAVGILLSLSVFARMAELFVEVGDSLSELVTFFGAAIPVFASITLSGGGVAAASVQGVGMSVALSVIGGGFTALLSASSGLTLAACLLSSIDNSALPVVKGVRGLFGWLLGLATALLVGTLSLQTVIATARDSAAMRAGKYAISGMIPVVGGTVSGALSTLASGLAYVKSIVGASSVLAVLTLSLSPLVSLLAYRAVLSAASVLSDMLGAPSGQTLSAFRASLDTLIATYALSATVMILEIVLFVKSGVAIE